MMGSMIGWMWVWPVLVLIGLVLLGYLAFRLSQPWGGGEGDRAGQGSSARRILDERYARGEIDETEYHRRRADLT